MADHDLPAAYSSWPETIEDLAAHVEMETSEVEQAFAEIGVVVEDRLGWGFDLAHVSSFHAAASGSPTERIRAAVAAFANLRGKEPETLGEDEPTGELVLADVCRKHRLDLDTFVHDVSMYGLYHFACAGCGSIELKQVQHDRIEDDLKRHPVKFAYRDWVTGTEMWEYIPGDIGEDEDPPEIGIECRICRRMHEGDLVPAAAALRRTPEELRDAAALLARTDDDAASESACS